MDVDKFAVIRICYGVKGGGRELGNGVSAPNAPQV